MKIVFENLKEFMDFYTNHKSIIETPIDHEITEMINCGNLYDIEDIISSVNSKIDDYELENYTEFICNLLEYKNIKSIKDFLIKNKIEDKEDNRIYTLIIKNMIDEIDYSYNKYIKPSNMKKLFEKGYDYDNFYNTTNDYLKQIAENNGMDIIIGDIDDYYDIFTEFRNLPLKETKQKLKNFIKDYKDDDNEYYPYIIKYINKYIDYLNSFKPIRKNNNNEYDEDN